MLVCLLDEVDMYGAFPYYGLTNKIPLNFDSKFHDFYLMKGLQNSIIQNCTIWLYLLHLFSRVKTTSNYCYT